MPLDESFWKDTDLDRPHPGGHQNDPEEIDIPGGDASGGD